jgi:hypothetical protein
MKTAKWICRIALIPAALALMTLTGCIDIDVGPDEEDQARRPAQQTTLTARTTEQPTR